MKITLDFQPGVSQFAGIGRYTRVLAGYLPSYLPSDIDLQLFYLDFRRRVKLSEEFQAKSKPYKLIPGAILQALWGLSLPPNYDLIAGKSDLYHFTNFIIPPLTKKAKTIVSVHDMSFMRHPECADKVNLRYLLSRIPKTIERADAIITLSEFSAREIVHFFPNAAGKVYPIYLGVDQSLSPRDEATVKEVRARYKLDKPYMISVGTIEPRKNYNFLIDLFEEVKEDVDLVIVGNCGWKFEPIIEKIKNSKKAERIHLLTGLGDGDLAALYTGAELYITPSLYEGFGFPPLEAMLSGIPVISSRGGSLEEVLGDSAVIVGSYDIDEWQGAITKTLSDPVLRERLKNDGMKRAGLFKWETTAEKTAKLYMDVLGGLR